ncbi:MAG: hypothetical protein KBT46_07170, partial [Ruminococcus sp.]|nr:hypothetical protein [Candidatus Copronaster equi]
LALANGGKAVPSFVFQHVPVKEIYQFVDEYEFNASAAERENAVFSIDDFKWYKLNDKITDGVIGEVPCSESRGGHTGEYEAWLEKGEIIGAFFGHDHVNNFTGTTDEGIRMGYNGGLGFSTYGRGSDRSARIFEIDENDVENYNTFEYTYKDCTGKDFSFFITDLISPVALSYVGKVLAVILPSFVKDIIAK